MLVQIRFRYATVDVNIIEAPFLPWIQLQDQFNNICVPSAVSHAGGYNHILLHKTSFNQYVVAVCLIFSLQASVHTWTPETDVLRLLSDFISKWKQFWPITSEMDSISRRIGYLRYLWCYFQLRRPRHGSTSDLYDGLRCWRGGWITMACKIFMEAQRKAIPKTFFQGLTWEDDQFYLALAFSCLET